MNRTLLTSCAVIAIAAGCGTASAQAKFDITLGGDAYFEAGYISQSDEGGLTRSTEFANRFRLVITPTAKSDNGLEYGARLRLRANSTGATTQTTADADQAFIFLQGGFGRIEAGVNDGPNNALWVGAPINFGTGGVDGAWNNCSTGAAWVNCLVFAQTNFGMNGPAGGAVFGSTTPTRINYFTPRFGGSTAEKGIQGALSYATVVEPTGSSATNVQRAKRRGAAGSTNTNIDDVYEIGLRYDEEIRGVTVAASAGYNGGAAVKDTVGNSYHNLSAYQAGLKLGYAGVQIGGGYVNAGKSGYSKNQATDPFVADQYSWNAGASYTTGPFSVGFNYMYGRDAGLTTARGSARFDMWTVGATYVIAPGLDVGLEYIHADTRLEAGVTTTASGVSLGANGRQSADAVIVRTNVAF